MTSNNYLVTLRSSQSKATIKTEDNVKIVIGKHGSIVQCDDVKCGLAGLVMNSVIQKELPRQDLNIRSNKMVITTMRESPEIMNTLFNVIISDHDVGGRASAVHVTEIYLESVAVSYTHLTLPTKA